MKTLLPTLLLATGFLIGGCGRQENNNREVLDKLEALRSEVAAGKRAAPVRWATANKSQITAVIFQWSRDKMEEVKRSEALPPDVEEKIVQYEAMKTELMHKQMETTGFRPIPIRAPRLFGSPAPAPAPEPPPATPAEKEVEALARRVAEAKAPIAEIVDRRSRQAAQFNAKYPFDRLIADYVKDRYDLVVDAERISNEKVLYRTAGEVPDITEGIIAFFREKAK